ncbi:MAG: glycosyltransferase family 2 protein [Bacteroidales bacterium]|nr:glycosyltransferase family 2 protein [Bacteroidales bacterium]MCM1416090.1 glycosyltransferase family 2 protein [bacterium]MCM1423118.1 glycosyltransferase family 2 protein [bacterium]
MPHETKRDGKIRSTIIIPNYNGIKYIENCLTSLADEPAEVLVVDNGSADGSRELVREKFPDVRVIALPKNYGFCAAVNRGIRESEKDNTTYVILLNNDTVAEPGFVRALEAALDGDEKVFSGAAKMVNLYRPKLIDDAGDYYCALGWAFAAGKDKPRERYDAAREIFSACGGACIYRRSVLREIGLLDEAHFAYLEDVDLGYRAKIYGYRNVYAPGAVVRHAGSGVSGSRHNAFKVRLSAQNSVYLIVKNMPPLQILLNLPFLLAGFLIKMLFFLKKGLGKSWFQGTAEGLRLSFSAKGRRKRVRFSFRHLPAYGRIQWELWRNLWYRVRL